MIETNIARLDVAKGAQAVAKRVDVPLQGGGGSGVKKADERRRQLLRPRRERPRRRHAAERGQELSSSDVACHVTLRLGVIHAMEG
jgi:hypothetical protein